jgi:hypothetical protein
LRFFFKKREILEFAINKEESSDRFLYFGKIPLILRKIFENIAAESGNLTLKVGGFTCMGK